MNTDFNLKTHNSFGINAVARFYTEIKDAQELVKLIRRGELSGQKTLVVGGGNNILFTSDIFNGIVIHINNKGIKTISDDDGQVIVRAQAGEDWPSFVKTMVSKGLYGIENLADIPGTVGAAPVQNIGAYGMELKDSFVKCEAINMETGAKRTFDNKECVFGYRTSIFKTMLRGQYAITSVDFRLQRQAELKLDYGNVRSHLAQKGIASPTLQQLHDTICEIRAEKLPNPSTIGNAGSFFKNPIIDKQFLIDKLCPLYSDIPFYDEPNGKVKIPAAWLIERCGWKGKRIGEVGVHDKQALVLVNHGGGSGKDIIELSKMIQDDIEKKFGIKITPEVNFV